MPDRLAAPVVRLDALGREVLSEAWRRASAREPCGYLLGGRDREGSLRVLSVVQGRNVHPAPGRAWALALHAQLRVRRAARARGQRVIGYWHGHLLGAGRPGRKDHAGRDPLGPTLHLIVGRGIGAQPEVRAWRASTTGFEPLVISAQASPRVPSRSSS